MNDNYDPAWVIAVLEDLREFCVHCGLTRSFVSIENAVHTVRDEIASAGEPTIDTAHLEAIPISIRQKN